MVRAESVLEQIAKELQKQFGQPVEWSAMIEQLRFAHHCTKAESIFILSRYFGLPYEDALGLVHNSQTWRDQKQTDDELNDLFWRVASSIDQDK